MDSPMIPNQRPEGGPESKKPTVKMRPPMRSSIACLRCRKSKIKCDNDGGNSPCDSCIKTGKECVFQLPEAVPTPLKRAEPPAPAKPEKEGGSERKKLKKVDDVVKLENRKASVHAEEVLSAPFLTEDLWEQLLDIYKLYFATELPFLHLPTVKERLGRRLRSSYSESGSADFNLVLLGILTLTARCHADLVKYVAHISSSQSGSFRSRPMQTQMDPSAASEYYADALATALGPVRTANRIASVERVQSLLMLGLYEWSQTLPRTGGLSAWMYVGIAIRMAQFLNLGFGDKADQSGGQTSRGLDNHRKSTSAQSEVALKKEIKRRTMFGCLIMDRMLACGKERVSIIIPEDLQIQLPCSEDKFDLAMEVRTAFLKPISDPYGERYITDDSVLSRFIRLVDIWGEISKFSYAGGRLTEKFPPWDTRTKFRKLREDLESFDKDLPGTFTWSKSNYFKHENHQASSVYVLLHMLRCVCLIMLHREYIPFVPIRCNRPVGPLDKPTFPESQYDIPEGFWLESAEQVFKAAREIVDLIEICQRKDKLPQSTIVMFAVWTAAFVGLYAAHFPHMDTEKHMLNHSYEVPRPRDQEPEVFRRGPTALTYQTLARMSILLKMASTYVGYLRQMDIYFDRARREFEQHNENGKALVDKLKLRKGGAGLEEYQRLAKQLKDFGHLQPDEQGHIDHADQSRASTSEPPQSVTAESYTASVADQRIRTAGSTPSGSFTAINHTPSHLDNDSSGFELRPGSSVSQSSEPSNRYQGFHHPHPHVSPIQSFAQAPTPVIDPMGQSPEWNDKFQKALQDSQYNRICTADLETFTRGEPADFDPTYVMLSPTTWQLSSLVGGDVTVHPQYEGF